MGKPFQELTISAVVVGSGAAGFNAVHRLWQYGVKDTALVTENRYSGTSRNTGSDKQTYYKISLSGSQDDSVRKLAKVLYGGSAVCAGVFYASRAGSSLSPQPVRGVCRV